MEPWFRYVSLQSDGAVGHHTEESSRLDAASPVPVEVLMDRAGLHVALAAVEMGAGYGSRVAVLAGTGNNGGDGWVAARYLQRRGAQVTVYSMGYPRGDDSPSRRAAVKAHDSGVAVRSLDRVEPADLVIDALFGVGFHGSLPQSYRHGWTTLLRSWPLTFHRGSMQSAVLWMEGRSPQPAP